MIEYGLILLTGFLTSLHCVGMCGAIVLAYSTSTPGSANGGWGSNVVRHIAYNAGRILAYALLGAVVGMVGIMIAGFERLAEIVAIGSGIIMIVAGMAMLGVFQIPTTLSLGGSGVNKLHGRLIRGETYSSKFSLGLLTPLLPCGILYAMLAKAAAAGGAVNGALTMGLFGLGMAPSLLMLGGLSSFFSAKIRKRAEMIAALAIILMGVTLVLRGLHVPFVSFIPMAMGAGGEHHSCCE